MNANALSATRLPALTFFIFLSIFVTGTALAENPGNPAQPMNPALEFDARTFNPTNPTTDQPTGVQVTHTQTLGIDGFAYTVADSSLDLTDGTDDGGLPDGVDVNHYSNEQGVARVDVVIGADVADCDVTCQSLRGKGRARAHQVVDSSTYISGNQSYDMTRVNAAQAGASMTIVRDQSVLVTPLPVADDEG